jgi:hypothetical protein
MIWQVLILQIRVEPHSRGVEDFHGAESTSRGCDRGEPKLIVLEIEKVAATYKANSIQHSQWPTSMQQY